MFAGIIETLGEVTAVEEVSQGRRLSVRASIFRDCELGDSVATSGTCLTVAEKENDTVIFDVASETLRRTTLGERVAGDSVNLERSLALGDRIDGHFVSGHVDAIGEVLELESEGETRRFVISYPEALAACIAEKGSIAVDGASMTLGEVTEASFSLYVIPHTFTHTTFRERKVGDAVNLEVDMLARYVQRALSVTRSDGKA